MGQLAIPLMIIGTGISVAGTLAQGKVAQQQARLQAQQLQEAAKVEAANAQRAAGEERRQTKLIQSKATAIGAASGAGGYEDIVQQIGDEGEYRALFALYNGQRASTGLLNQAEMAKFEGDQAIKSSRINAASTIMSSAAYMVPMAQKYGGTGYTAHGTGNAYVTSSGASVYGYR